MFLKINAKLDAFRGKIRDFSKDQRGVAAIEFAFIAPMMITLYLGTMEISRGLQVNKKVGRSASTIGDLVAQEDGPKKVDIQSIMKVGKSLIQPYARSVPTFIVTEIEIDAAGTSKVYWSQQLTGTVFTTPYAKNSTITIPAKVKIAGTHLVKVETKLEYLPLTSWSIQKNKAGGTYAAVDMAEVYYFRPRVGDRVECSDC